MMRTLLVVVLSCVAAILAWLLLNQIATLAFRQTIAPVVNATPIPRPTAAPLSTARPGLIPTPYVMASDIARKYGITPPPIAQTPDPVFTQDIKYTVTAEPAWTPQK
jgi:hypothetical protein